MVIKSTTRSLCDCGLANVIASILIQIGIFILVITVNSFPKLLMIIGINVELHTAYVYTRISLLRRPLKVHN
ncbi:hypothetical protein HanRHA438_Chr05g0207251 [Helianthus annuus]|nr:hypothetical protein HanRHA438_Chr05g0207251 [Helianthus annuus]